MQTKIKIKEDLLDAIQEPIIEDSFGISEDKIKEPLYYEGTAVRCFCLGCGTSTELLPEGAIHLAELAEVDIPLSWNNFYFVSQSCIICAKDYYEVNLKKIK